jgi:hypothetical protein
MTESSSYKKHLKVAMESKRQPCTCNEFKAERSRKIDVAACDATGIGSVVCLRNGFFIPEATVDFQKGEQYELLHDSVQNFTDTVLSNQTKEY